MHLARVTVACGREGLTRHGIGCTGHFPATETLQSDAVQGRGAHEYTIKSDAHFVFNNVV